MNSMAGDLMAHLGFLEKQICFILIHLQRSAELGGSWGGVGALSEFTPYFCHMTPETFPRF